MLMASIVIMAVPEGLPMMNSLVQSMNTESMYKKNILVSHKAAFSDSAYMNVLFSDKTGTITQGNLSLVEFITGDGNIVNNIQNREFVEAITLNNLAKISSEGKAIGSNNMDRALLSYAIANGYDDSKNDHEKVEEISGFDSEKKCATVKLKNGLVYWKGATENILEDVTHYMLPDGEEREFSAEDKKKVEEQMLVEAKRTMKLLSVAKISDGKTVLMAVLCLRDNVRTDAIETVQILNSAGIQVVMVTGDAEETAFAIAKEAGILKDEKKDVVLTHDQLEKMSDEELKKVLPNLKVVSRAKPLDKKRLVSISQQLDNVCGMTGDGVNDAPAIKNADIGVGMGITGTDVTKNVSDMVLADDNFATIVYAVKEGRRIYDNIRKSIQFLLSSNLSEVIAIFFATLIGFVILKPVHLLWINLITDCFPALALGTEKAEEDIMKRKPRSSKESIFAGGVSVDIIWQGFMIAIITIIAYVVGHYMESGIWEFVNSPDGMTMAFLTMSMAEIFHSFNLRSRKHSIFTIKNQNKFLWGAMIVSLLLTLAVIYIPFLSNAFGLEEISFIEYIVSILMAFTVIPIVELVKYFQRKK